MNDKAQAAMDLAVKEALERAFKLGATEGAKQVVKLEAKLAEFRDWPCENDGCEHTLGDVMAHDANHPKPTSGGTWFCAACWNRALGGLKAKLAEVTAADRATRIALVEVETALLEAETALAASQAHVVELRAALDVADGSHLHADDCVTKHSNFKCDCNRDETKAEVVRRALARESSTDALREFGLRVARAIAFEPPTSTRNCEAIVDAVLWGDHE